jgi:hypothetical protein
LISSLKEMGYEPQVHKKPVSLHGYRGDKRSQKAHIIIPRNQVGSASNDVGFENKKGTYTLHASEFDKAWRTGAKIKTLNKTYSENRIKQVVNKNSNYRITNRQLNKDGKIEIQIRIN